MSPLKVSVWSYNAKSGIHFWTLVVLIVKGMISNSSQIDPDIDIR